MKRGTIMVNENVCGKILGVSDGIVTIGLNSGGITEVRIEDVNYGFKIGDAVEIFQSETRTIVAKHNDPAFQPSDNSLLQQPQGININISNANNSSEAYPSGKKAVNKVAYLLLAFFLGGIGAHKFYAGKVGSGILYLLFCWTFIPAFLALIEFIVALFRKSDNNGNILV